MLLCVVHESRSSLEDVCKESAITTVHTFDWGCNVTCHSLKFCKGSSENTKTYSRLYGNVYLRSNLSRIQQIVYKICHTSISDRCWLSRVMTPRKPFSAFYDPQQLWFQLQA